MWFWRPDAGVKLVGKYSSRAGDGGNKPVTGKSTKETVKTIAQETPGDFGEPVVTTVCLLPFAHGLRVHRASGVSCAL